MLRTIFEFNCSKMHGEQKERTALKWSVSTENVFIYGLTWRANNGSYFVLQITLTICTHVCKLGKLLLIDRIRTLTHTEICFVQYFVFAFFCLASFFVGSIKAHIRRTTKRWRKSFRSSSFSASRHSRKTSKTWTKSYQTHGKKKCGNIERETNANSQRNERWILLSNSKMERERWGSERNLPQCR